MSVAFFVLPDRVFTAAGLHLGSISSSICALVMLNSFVHVPVADRSSRVQTSTGSAILRG